MLVLHFVYVYVSYLSKRFYWIYLEFIYFILFLQSKQSIKPSDSEPDSDIYVHYPVHDKIIVFQPRLLFKGGTIQGSQVIQNREYISLKGTVTAYLNLRNIENIMVKWKGIMIVIIV